MPISQQSPGTARYGRTGLTVVVLALYLATSVGLFGWPLWPHPGRGILGLTFQDPEIFIWSFAWWPHAIGSLTNPFVTNVVYYPVGANLMWTASAPGLALAFAPLTVLVGPAASYNVAMLLLPALAGWTAFLLCRDLTRSTWASIVGGYLYGFSSYVVSHEYGGEPNLGVFLVPLVALLVLRQLRGALSARGLAWRLGVILAVQFTISTELTLTLTLALAAGLLIASVVAREHRRRILSVLAPIAAAYGIAAVLAAPFVAYLVAGFESGKFVGASDGDLLNIVVPTRLIAVGGSMFDSITRNFATNEIDTDLYLGIPTLIVVSLYSWRHRREPPARFLLAALVLAWVLALGTSLRVDGRRVVALPWSLASSVPLLANVVATRLAAYASLAASVAVALWIGSTRGRVFPRPYVLPVLALASIVPATWHVAFARDPGRPPFFTQALYERCIPRGEVLALFPYGRFGDSMLWQAESGFWFKMAEGNLGRDTYPPSFVFADPTVTALQFYYYGPNPRPTMPELKVFAERRRVDRIVSLASGGYPDAFEMQAFGPSQLIGGVLVAPACGHHSLAGHSRRIQASGGAPKSRRSRGGTPFQGSTSARRSTT